MSRVKSNLEVLNDTTRWVSSRQYTRPDFYAEHSKLTLPRFLGGCFGIMMWLVCCVAILFLVASCFAVAL